MMIVLFYASCNSQQNSKYTEKDIVAEFDGETIYANEINTIIKQELYDELCRIHEIKKKALEQLINVKLLQKEADKKQMTYQEYIDDYANTQIKKFGIDSLLKQYRLESITEFRGKSIYSVAVNSPTGKVTRDFHLKGAIVDELLDSLKRDKKIVQYLYPPKSPSINLNNLHAYYRGDLQSEVSVTIISDFDCESCIKAHPLYNSIYEDYKEKVKFGYIHYSTMPTFAEIASDAANKQNRFWEFQDSLYAYKGYIDSTAVFKIAHNMSIDINKFQKDIASNDGKKAIENTINQLVLLGVYATPTLIINGRLIVDSNSKEEICHLIDEELSK
ncbi:thioredoxin domain-containing protein [Bacteroides sp. A1-P5]|uniref:Thioredoxin domain-containing protein n=1 Tax=Bacteroides vicugnae TaxID=3037989 RepID=A0ABU5HVG4_9BACE|nr:MULTISPECIES: thioredoxin domain-containing protein [unclassified Bacteroides]MDY7255159.1 thioredoxin domain-containing protein [Bacteroides sp. A1-P5]MDY7259567.1 thioredoxin domain-containing protein [Bacteroides sp. A2-P53]